MILLIFLRIVLRRRFMILFTVYDIPAMLEMFNEGLMELGEVICIPNGMPKCDSLSFERRVPWLIKMSNYYLFPVKDEKKEKEEVDMTVIIPIWQGKTSCSEKRKSPGLLT